MATDPNDLVTPLEVTNYYGSEDQFSKKEIEGGLTKREYYAGQFASGFAAAGSTGMPDPKQLAQYIVKATDALINALNDNP